LQIDGGSISTSAATYDWQSGRAAYIDATLDPSIVHKEGSAQ
jgi:hypothetical protein